jgi:hypothetical protein
VPGRRLALGLCAAVAVAGCSADEPAPEPPADLAADVETFDDLSTEHVEGEVDYDQAPPVGGPHNARWLACAVYDEPVPAETAVHSLEHGAVWLAYDPTLDDSEVAELGALAALDEEYVLVSPYDGVPSPVVATAWGVQLEADGADDPRLVQFVETYAGGAQGGEPGAPCATNGLTLDEAEQAVAGD